ncbi:VOC family protein, partial [Thiolapillus sp.]
MDRAIRFYSAVFGYSMERHKMDVIDMVWFPMHPESPGAMGRWFATGNSTGLRWTARWFTSTCPVVI